MVNNYDWFKEMSFLQFIRDVGKHITVNYMMSKESVRKRIESEVGISFTEFTYQLIQGYDFYWLYQNKNCKLQMGGSDQWGNIITGTELIRRKAGGEAFAFTCPLLTKADGGKFGKTESGNVWLDPEKTSPYHFFQFWLNATDADAEKWIKIFTFLPADEINNLVEEHLRDQSKRILQKRLAKELTIFVHGVDEYFAGIGKYDFASIAFPTANNKRTLAVTGLRFAVDDIMNTLFLVEPDGSINYNNIQAFSSADYAFLLSFAQNLKQSSNKNIDFGLNAKIIHRNVGKFAKAWGFGLDAGLQVHSNKWKFGFVGRDITTTFNTWTFNFTEKEKEVLYLTNNEIPVKSTELTAPRLVIGVARDFLLTQNLSLLAEANLDITFDGQRNTPISADPVSADPKLGLELNINKIVYVRGGINNFQKALADGDTLNQKKVWIYQPSAGVGFQIQNVKIDYAFTNLANQSNPLFTHVFSLQVVLVNDKNKKKK